MAEFSPINYVAYQDPASAAKLQQQQMLAQLLMAQGQKESNPYERAGRLVVPQSPLSGLSKMASMIGGAYLQNKSSEDLAKALQGPSQQDMLGMSTNAAIGDETGGNLNPQAGRYDSLGNPIPVSQDDISNMGAVQGPATKQDVASRYQQGLANALQGGGGSPGMNPQEMRMEMFAPGMGKASYEARLKNYYAGPTAGAEAAAKAPYDIHTGPGGKLVTTSQITGGAPAPAALPPSLQPTVAAPIKPPVKATPEQIAGAADLFNVSNEPATAPVTAPVDITNPKGTNPDWNDPAAVKEADAAAGKTGENVADINKTLTVMQSNLPMVLDRFEKMRGAAKDASYGPTAVDGADGSPAMGVTFHDMLNDKTAQANGIIQQTSAQGVLPELGPTLAQAGIKGNKFLETLSSNASAIPLHQGPDVKLNTINGLETQYINNLKSTAKQARAFGQQGVPTDEEIDNAVKAHKTSGSKNPAETKTIGGITYTKINGQWHQ